MNLADIKALYQKKQDMLLSIFSESKQNPQKVYEKIIDLGRTLSTSNNEITKDEYLIHGCQSRVYLTSAISTQGVITYDVHSDALISSGLASLLLFIYNKEKIELTLFCPPVFIQELGLPSALSIGRSNGLASMYTRMQQDAKKLFVQMHTVV